MIKTKKILIGTHNRGKFREISQLLPKKLRKLSPETFNIRSPKETGKTFLQNSILKVNYFYKRAGIPSISDDSGLEIKYLKYKPGIHSARWAKKNGGFRKAMKKILKLMGDTKKREAFFVCSLSLRVNNKKVISTIGKLKGSISKKILGNKGFGYDSIFIPDKKKITFGQMSPKKKLMTDHRYLAFRKLKKKSKVF